MGWRDADVLPEWAAELKMRQYLWVTYGIPFDDMTVTDVMRDIKLREAELQRQKTTNTNG